MNSAYSSSSDDPDGDRLSVRWQDASMALETFAHLVSSDEHLIAVLARIDDANEFVATCLSLADQAGISLTEEFIVATMRMHRRAWAKVNVV